MCEWHWHVQHCHVLSILTLSTRKSSGLDNRIVPVSQFSSWNQPKSLEMPWNGKTLTNETKINCISFMYTITKSKFTETIINCLVISAMCIKMQGWLAILPMSWLAPLSQVLVKVDQMPQTVILWPDLVIYDDTPPQHPTTATNNKKFSSACSFKFFSKNSL